MTKKNIERQFVQSQMEKAQKRTNDLELEVKKLNNTTQKQQKTNF